MKRIRKRKSTQKNRKRLLKKKKLTKKEYSQLKGKAVRKFREASLSLADKDFEVEIFRKFKVKKGKRYVSRFIRIGASEFIPDREYRIFVRHKPTKQRRMLAIGKFRDIPIRSKDIQKFQHQLGGRTFNPKLKYPQKAIGKWVPVDKIVAGIQREIQEHATDRGAETRGAIIPMKRYFHTEWKIYSDHILKGKTFVKRVLVNCAVEFIYPQQQWIGKQTLFLDFERRIQLKNIHRLIEQFEGQMNRDLGFLHPQADNVELVEVNGFIPLGV